MEKRINTSGKLRTILKKISSESWIADLLYKGKIDEDLLVDDYVNYIRISGSDDSKISYLPQKKIKAVIDNVSKINNRDLKEFQIPLEYFYKAKGRVKIKYGSFVNKLFKNVPPKDVEKFASLLKSIVDQPDYTFKVVSGDSIRGYYHGSHHASSRGSLGVSCMRHDNCQNYFNMYTASPEIKMVMMMDLRGKILARAILWHLDEKNGLDGEFKFMDRIYSTKDDQFHLFHEWAKQNGYVYKEKQSWNTPYRFKFKDDIFHKKMKIKLTNPPHVYAKENNGGGLPYLDTFKWMNLKNGTLYNYKPDEEPLIVRRNIYTTVSTKGRLYGYNYIKEDEQNLEFWYEGELKFVEYLDKWISDRYLYYSNINKTYILQEHAIIEKYTNDYIFGDEYDYLNEDDLIDEQIELVKERKRKEREKLEKDVKLTLKDFSKFTERGNKFLDGEIKSINKTPSRDREKVVEIMRNYAKVGDEYGLRDFASNYIAGIEDEHELSNFNKFTKSLIDSCRRSKGKSSDVFFNTSYRTSYR